MIKRVGFLSVLLMSIICVFTSCSKDEDVDIRDSYVGTYQGTERYTNGGTNYSNAVSVNVVKSEVSSNKIIISSTFFNASPEIVQAAVQNGEFSGAFTSQINGISTTVTVTNGQVNGNTISYSYTAPDFVTVTVNATKL
jgi:hypothetical protein